MKKIYLITAVFFLLVFASCNKMLDEEIKHQIAGNYLNTPAGLEEGVKACYSTLRDWYGQQSAGWMTVFGTDEFINGGADPAWDSYSPNVNSASGVVSGTWGSLYKGINNCNAVIDRAENIEGMDEDLMNTRVAEAKFLRAHYHYLLAETFGDIPLQLSETRSASTEASRTPIDQVYKAIIEDLKFGVDHLPVTATDYGRITISAAKHMLARVYITRAASSFAESGDYENAAKYAKEVINTSGGARLLDDFGDIYKIGNETNDEVIFSVQYTDDVLLNGNGNYCHMFFLSQYDKQPGMYRDLENGRPWTHYRPTVHMQNLFNEYDSRNEKSFRRVWYCNKPGNYEVDGHTISLSLGDTAYYLSPIEVSNEVRLAANYKIITPSEYTHLIWPCISKYTDPNRPSINEKAGTRDFTVYRLADTYLLAAEALMMQDKKDEAVQYVNIVRRRAARLGNTSAETEANRKAMEVSASDLDIDFILDERSRELAGEYMRWFDLKRTHKLIERVRLYNELAAPNIKEYHLFRPIPLTQIDRTEGGAEAFPQNPGY